MSVGGGFAWAPLANASFGYGVGMNANLYTFDGGVQIHAASSSRLVPYLAVGGGAVRVSAKATMGGVKYFGASDSVFAANFGGGFRAGITKRFGVRFEALGFKGKDTNIFGRALVGVYGQFGGR